MFVNAYTSKYENTTRRRTSMVDSSFEYSEGNVHVCTYKTILTTWSMHSYDQYFVTSENMDHQRFYDACLCFWTFMYLARKYSNPVSTGVVFDQPASWSSCISILKFIRFTFEKNQKKWNVELHNAWWKQSNFVLKMSRNVNMPLTSKMSIFLKVSQKINLWKR